jgi:hypothetical protein
MKRIILEEQAQANSSSISSSDDLNSGLTSYHAPKFVDEFNDKGSSLSLDQSGSTSAKATNSDGNRTIISPESFIIAPEREIIPKSALSKSKQKLLSKSSKKKTGLLADQIGNLIYT